jgi:hypothetical protein
MYNGYYDDNGHWRKTKHCFVSCGSRCNCSPPGGQYYSEQHDKKLFQKAVDLLVETPKEEKP